ncbi:phosphate starvation-inducible protein PhoH [Candidatus Fermentibacteria bacterium]|nr:MAG: phosphate starvation-inducible protein PhoH [Candidatus Fermentibacteria bacterium]
MKKPENRRVPLTSEDARILLGAGDSNLREICRVLGVAAVYRGGNLIFTGERGALDRAQAVTERLVAQIRAAGNISASALAKALEFPELRSEGLVCSVPGRAGRIIPRTPGQEAYMKSMLHNELVFSIGPAGTGKTFLAVAEAVSALRDNRVERIILTRPAVEAGENLGFLPGDLQQKIDPYLRPIFDALNDTLTPSRVQKYMESRIIEVAPLAYMRGRTLNNAFVILDEAQNTTLTQLKMFLTRMGYGSRLVVTGDVTQIDLRPREKSGLVQIAGILRNVSGIGFVYLEREDVVRHPLVQRIIKAFSREDNR